MEKEKGVSANEVYKSIRRRIIRLELEPGQMISENQMSQEYGVSRSVIRSAFVKLEQLKFIDIYPQKGTFVSRIDIHHISDLLMLRTAVEKEVIYEMFYKLKREDRARLLTQLEENILEQEKYSGDREYSQMFGKLDSQFHKIMIDSVNRYTLVMLLEDLLLHISRWRNFDVAFDNRIPELITEHRNIVEGLRADDLELTQRYIASHLETVTSIYDRAVRKYPGYFVV